MDNKKVLKKLKEIQRQFEISVEDGMDEIATNDAKEVLRDNKECVEALKMAIETLSQRRSTGKKDISGQEVLEGDIIESHLGGQILALNMVVRYGTYQAYCPVDECYMDSVGFYVSAEDLPDMPVGSLEDYAKIIGQVIL